MIHMVVNYRGKLFRLQQVAHIHGTNSEDIWGLRKGCECESMNVQLNWTPCFCLVLPNDFVIFLWTNNSQLRHPPLGTQGAGIQELEVNCFAVKKQDVSWTYLGSDLSLPSITPSCNTASAQPPDWLKPGQFSQCCNQLVKWTVASALNRYPYKA